MKMNNLVLTTILFSLAAGAKSQTKAVDAPFSKGVNFSDWLERPHAGLVQKNFFCEQDFKDVRELGCDAIRLPVHFENFSSGAGEYKIDPYIFSILDNAVKWAAEQKIFLILDNHSWSPAENTAKDIEKRLLKIWPQIAERYKNSGKYLAYEILNEPHGIENAKWGKIQQNVIEAIRTIDKTHAIVVGGADWNSFESLLALPKFQDENLIYTFHYYEPMMFTHQGADWTEGLARIKGVPFPYAKEKIPPKPKNPSASENWYYENYEKVSSPKSMAASFEKLAKFSVERNAPVWCGEFGVFMNFASHEDRVKWYEIVAEYLDEANIARTNWDYRNSFGLFKKGSGEFFPDDLDEEILRSLKYDIPKKTSQNLSWCERAKKSGDFSIYENSFAQGLRARTWFDGDEKSCHFEKQDSRGENFVEFGKLKTYNGLYIDFLGGADLSNERAQNYFLEFEASTKQDGVKIQVYFENGKRSQEKWRCAANVTSKILPSDGEWHKVKIPLKDFQDIGAWNDEKKQWISSRGLFDWSDILQIAFSNEGAKITKGIRFKEIRLSK